MLFDKLTDNHALLQAVIHYNANDPKRIHHLLKVYEFAKYIGEGENLDERTQFILETAAILHDIGIKNAEQIYGSSNGKYQEELGPDVARQILWNLNYDSDITDRVCYLVGHHHTYHDINGNDYQILVEADFLVNLYEDQIDEKGCEQVYRRIFKTRTGKNLLKSIYLNDGTVNNNN